MAALLLPALAGACTVGDEAAARGDDAPGAPGANDAPPGDDPWPSAGCAPYGSDVYTPYTATGAFPTGPVSAYPWHGPAMTYPAGDEDFRAYTASLPTSVECGATRGERSYLEVTAGCLDAVAAGGGVAGRVDGTTDGYFRTFALPYADGDTDHVVKWTDQAVEYRFFYGDGVGTVGNTGFKAFVRYRTEYDLYVGSWRLDGVVQIQKKQCGEYTILQRDATFGAPARNAWHTIRFEAVGDELRFSLDGALVMTQRDATFASGTVGIRIDAMDGALIDDWRAFAP